MPTLSRSGKGTSLDLVFLADPTIYDGRWANNGWLQELPKPITKLTWDNAALMSSGDGPGARRRPGQLRARRRARRVLHAGGRAAMSADDRCSAPAWIVPGHADGAVIVYLGYGRECAGESAASRNNKSASTPIVLRTADRPWFAAGLACDKTGGHESGRLHAAAPVDGEPRAGPCGDAEGIPRRCRGSPSNQTEEDVDAMKATQTPQAARRSTSSSITGRPSTNGAWRST